MLRRGVIFGLTALILVSPALAQRYDPHFQDASRPWTEEGRGSRDRDHEPERDRREAPPPERRVTLGVIVRDLKQRFGGRLLDAKPEGDRYTIFWFDPGGHRLTIVVDAATGRIISER